MASQHGTAAKPTLREILTAIATAEVCSGYGVSDLAVRALEAPDPLLASDLDIRLQRAVGEVSRDAQGRWWDAPGTWTGPAACKGRPHG